MRFQLVLAVLVLGTVGCSADDSSSTKGNGGGTAGISNANAGVSGNQAAGTSSSSSGSVGSGEPCTNLQCQQQACSGGGSTTISGTVYDPAGKNPLYDVVVYVPNMPVLPLAAGASCDECDSLYSGMPIATALTDAAGKFTLTNAPVGANIPLVIQVGKWRKQVTVANVEACKDNPQPDKSLALPKNHTEGDIPNIAISTGGADTLECLLRRIGVDAAEYGPGPGGEGRIHIFQGSAGLGAIFGLSVAPNTSPPAPSAPAALWNSVDELKKYDIVLLSCEGAETASMNQQALHDYADMGGRVFASHFHYSWFNSGPYANENLATWVPGGNAIGDINASIVTTLSNGMPFPKGMALHDWLGNVNALQGDLLPIQAARHNADVTPANTPSQTWIVADPSAQVPGAVQYLSFNTPTNGPPNVDGPAYCGRVVFSDLHVGAASGDLPLQPVPGECADVDLSPQEKALEFMLFDLSACVVPDNAMPAPPPIDLQ